MRLGLGMRLSDALKGGGTAVVPKSTLVDDLVSYWSLDEVSGTRADAVGSNDLTDNNTVGVAYPGPSGNVANLVAADTTYFSVADSATTVWGEDGNGCTWSGWVYANAKVSAGDYVPLLLRATDTRNWEVFLTYDDTGVGSNLLVQDEGGVGATKSGGPVVVGYWAHVIAWFDPSDKKSYVSVNGGTAAASSARGTASLAATSGTVQIGYWSFSESALSFELGRVGIWNRVLTSDERTSLFNSGAGKAYADLTTAEKVGLVSYWNLDETSAGAAPVTRVDAHGDNDLTDNGTTASAVNTATKNGNAASFVAGNVESLSVSLTLPATFSVSFWWKRTATAGFPGIFETNNRSFEIYLVANDLYVGSQADENNIGAVIPSGQWKLVVATFDGIDLITYIDGDAEDTNAGWSHVANASFSIGAASFGASTALIDEFGLWSRALTSDEVAELFNGGDGKFYNATTEDFE